MAALFSSSEYCSYRKTSCAYLLQSLLLRPCYRARRQAETIRVGVTAGPHAEIIDVVKKVAAERGLDIKVVEFTDYVVPNQALALKDLEANSFQHEPYLKNQISKTGWNIVKVANTIASPQGVYSLKYKKLSDLPEGARVAIANDPSNGARGLMILALHGAIKLKDPNNVASTIADITDNPKKLRFIELDAAQLPRSLQDVDVVSINNNYAVQAGLQSGGRCDRPGGGGRPMGQHHRGARRGQGQALGQAIGGCLPLGGSESVPRQAIQGDLHRDVVRTAALRRYGRTAVARIAAASVFSEFLAA